MLTYSPIFTLKVYSQNTVPKLLGLVLIFPSLVWLCYSFELCFCLFVSVCILFQSSFPDTFVDFIYLISFERVNHWCSPTRQCYAECVGRSPSSLAPLLLITPPSFPASSPPSPLFASLSSLSFIYHLFIFTQVSRYMCIFLFPLFSYSNIAYYRYSSVLQLQKSFLNPIQ